MRFVECSTPRWAEEIAYALQRARVDVADGYDLIAIQVHKVCDMVGGPKGWHAHFTYRGRP